jgi:glycosyltransferase involved in cell wall biosynthesis
MVSLIVPACNEERLIGRTLGALHAAATALKEPYEIIVVDDGSTDATSAIAVREGARVLRVNHRQIAAVRNAGAAEAAGELLVFVDADTDVPGTVLGAAVHAMRNGAVGGGARARFDDPVPLYGRALAWSWLRLQRFGHLASGCFIFCTRKAFEAVGGFDQTLYAAEDVALSRRLRKLGPFVIVPGIVVTSGRSVRTHSGAEALRILAGFVLLGPSFFKTRRGPWYGQRRGDRDSTV